jgi:hypothetical protein
MATQDPVRGMEHVGDTGRGGQSNAYDGIQGVQAVAEQESGKSKDKMDEEHCKEKKRMQRIAEKLVARWQNMALVQPWHHG